MPRITQRQLSSPFVNNIFYRFFNDVLPKKTISAGRSRDSNGAINMTIQDNFSSSENWQLYNQNGYYFIRNYDYGSTMQLALSQVSGSIPRLLPRSGELGQQWTLSRWDDGSWKVENMLLGNGTYLGLSTKNTIPAMQASEKGAHWNIDPNASAGTISDPGMLTNVSDVQNPSSSLSPSLSPSSSPSSPSSVVIVPASSTSGPSHPLSNNTPNGGSSLSASAIAGIVVGAVVFLAAIALAVFLLLYRKKKKNPYTPAEVDGQPVTSGSEKYAQRFEVEGPLPEMGSAIPNKKQPPVEIG